MILPITSFNEPYDAGRIIKQFLSKIWVSDTGGEGCSKTEKGETKNKYEISAGL